MASKDWLSDEAVMLGILFPKLEMDWERCATSRRSSTGCWRKEAAKRQGLLPSGTAQRQVRNLLDVTRPTMKRCAPIGRAPMTARSSCFGARRVLLRNLASPTWAGAIWSRAASK